MKYCLFTLVLFPFVVVAQFAPPVGQIGTTAMYKDSSAFVQWASGAVLQRGYQDVSNISLGLATVGDSSFAFGKAGDNGPVSLGDGGSIILTFDGVIKNGAGFDFAVFENSFSDDFLELAFVEVSSDGVNFFRFPAISNTDTTTQTGSFGSTDATKINNLAGKYRALYGTPFDLEELKNEVGLDVNNITHVKIIDVVGSINNTYATRDKNNRKINDPWPTAFGSSGFDLDAVGVIHFSSGNGVEEMEKKSLVLYPNPLNNSQNLTIEGGEGLLTIVDLQGKVMFSSLINEGKHTFSFSNLNEGMYIVSIQNESTIYTQKLIVR